MQDNTQNNWKTLLENPESLPGETIRTKNETWEKLYSRLHKKPRRKLLAWYWAAASLLILLIGSVIIFVHKEKHKVSLVIVPPTKKQMPVTAESALSTEQKNSNYDLSPSKQKSSTAAVNQKHNSIKTIQPLNNNITDSIIKQLPEMVIASSLLNDSAVKTITAAVPIKKKLRVVHLNEIGQPAEEPTVNNRFTEGHGFEFRIINSEIYNPVSSSSSNNGLILTKPRNTSN